MFEYFAGDEAPVAQKLLKRLQAFGSKVLLRGINVMHTVYLSERPEVSTDKRHQLGIEIVYHICTVF